MASWSEYMGKGVIGTVFKSYWIHTAIQVAVVLIMIGWDGFQIMLMMLTSSYLLMLLYLLFQFPITSFLLLFSYKSMMRYARGQGLVFRLIFSSGLFILLACLVSFLLIHLFSMTTANQLAYSDLIMSQINVVVSYLSPAFLLGEVIRQRFVLKNVYFSNGNS